MDSISALLKTNGSASNCYDGERHTPCRQLTTKLDPVALARLTSNQTKANRLLGNVYAEAEFTKGLSYKMDFGFDIFSDAQGTFRPSTIPLSNTAGNQPSEAEATSQTSQRYNWVFEQTLNYNKDFGEHHLNALGGWTMQYQRDESNYMFANGFISNSIQTLNAGTVTRGNSQASEWALLSALARLQYSYKASICFQRLYVPTELLVLAITTSGDIFHLSQQVGVSQVKSL